MKKTLLIASAASLLFASQILPQNFGNCSAISFFNKYNAPIALNDYMKIVKKYSCGNNIIYMGIENRIPGILKLKTDTNSNNFLLKHFTIQNFPAAVYIDKRLHKGVIAVKLNNKQVLKILFNSLNYKLILKKLSSLDIQKIKEKL